MNTNVLIMHTVTYPRSLQVQIKYSRIFEDKIGDVYWRRMRIAFRMFSWDYLQGTYIPAYYGELPCEYLKI